MLLDVQLKADVSAAVRALRPLRTITRFSSLRAIVVCFLEALPLLATITLFLVFLFFLFALVRPANQVCQDVSTPMNHMTICYPLQLGLLLFQEAYHNACINIETGELAEGSVEGSARSCGFRACPEGYICQQSDERYPSVAPGFDNIGLAMLTVFQITTIR